MADVAKVLRDAIGHLRGSVAEGGRDAIVLDVEILLGLTADLIATGNHEPVRDAMPDMQRVFELSLICDDTAARDDATVGRLETLTALFSLVSLRPGQSDLEKVAAEPVVAALLRVLAACDAPTSNQALAAASGYGEATVARTMPRLRSLGLVRTHREWRTKLNRITDAGRSLVLPAPSPA